MNTSGIKAYIKTDRKASIGFFLVSTFFFLGLLIGSISANYLSIENAEILRSFFLNSENLFYAEKSFLSCLLSNISLSLLSIFLGFSFFGFTMIPPLSGIRGFFLSFSAAAVIRALGKEGFIIAFARFGIPAIISLPCFFILCVQSFGASYGLTGRILNSRSIGAIYEKDYFLRCAFCLGALVLAAILETYFSPLLTAAAAGL
jgi:hypothetical protein